MADVAPPPPPLPPFHVRLEQVNGFGETVLSVTGAGDTPAEAYAAALHHVRRTLEPEAPTT